MSKVLVSYFSASGVTREVAEKIATALTGDLFEIEPVDKYTNEDLDWTNKQSGSSGYEGSFNDLKNTYTDINFISGRRFKGNETDEEYRNWIK